MNNVYLLLKHPPHPYRTGGFLEAATVEDVFLDRAQAIAAAEEKNKRALYVHWSVKQKRVKEKPLDKHQNTMRYSAAIPANR